MTETSADESEGGGEPPIGSPAEPGPAVASPAGPGPAEASPAGPRLADPTLEAAIERDLARGRRLATLTWLIAALHAVLGFVVVRQSAMLVDVDHDLITTGAVEAFGGSFVVVRVALVGVIAIACVLAVRWLRGAVRTLEVLADLGGVEGASGHQGGRRRRLGVLLRPAGVAPDRVTWAEVRVGGDRRLAAATVAALMVAASVGAVGAAGLALAGRLETAQAWRWVVAIDAGLWIIATVLAGALVSRISWRMAVAGRAVGIFAPLSDAPGRLVVRLAPALLLFAGLLPAIGSAPAGAHVDCPSVQLDCAAVIVPVDHRGSSVQESIAIVYGVHRATGLARGTLVVAVGGPGGSGLNSADSMIESFDDELVDRYDIVFWDQRGVGKSDGHDCPIAGGIYSSVETTAESARAFVEACLNESGTRPIDLRRYATAQAAEDLETIRERLGVDRFTLYGESYGTSLGQAYATAHPDRLTGLILDGAVDLTLGANDFWAAATKGFDHTLTATFDACEADEFCADDVADPAGSYDRLLARLAGVKFTVRYADADGESRDHQLDRNAVETAVGALMYEPAGRALVERAIAASDAGDDVPMSRLVDWFGPGINPVFSTFAYFAVMCGDYRVSPTENASDFDAVLASGRENGALATRTDDVYLAQIPCLYWPAQPASPERPAPLTNLSVPVIVLGATMDPITPIDFGRAIAKRAADGYLIETRGGPHVTFSRGDPCVDDTILAFLLRDELPSSREKHCFATIASPYIPLTPLDADDYADAIDAMASVEDELFAEPLYAFGATGDLQSGCRFGGYVTVRTSDAEDTFELAGCEFARGMPLDGSGTYNYNADELTLDVTFPGGSLEYTSGDVRSVHGTFRGVEVDEGE